MSWAQSLSKSTPVTNSPPATLSVTDKEVPFNLRD